MNDAELLAYSDGSYSTSDWGCSGDTIAISPRPFEVPGYLRMYTSWARALREATDACALQQGPCWVLKPSQTRQRCGQPAYGSCPSCIDTRPSSAPVSLLSGFSDAVRREAADGWVPVAVVTEEGVARVLSDGCVLPLWQRVFSVTPPDRLVRERAGLTYRAAVAAAQELARRTRTLRVVQADVPSRHSAARDKVVPVVYVDPGGIVRAAPEACGFATQVDRMDPLEVREAFMLSRGGSLMPHGM
jgi:hypothetical protein